MKNKKILLVTRPIGPPWDEASKNFAFYLAKNLTGFDLGVLTNGIVADLPENVRQLPIYTSNSFSFLQKMRLLKNLRKFKNDFDVLHHLFTPTKQNSFLIKNFISSKNQRQKTIQTVATLREDLYSDEELKKMLFADLIITYSDYAKNKLKKLGFKNVKRIYPGIDLQYYSAQKKDNEALKSLGLKEDDFVVTFPGEYVRLGATDDIARMIVENVATFREKNIKIIFACRLKNDPKAIAKKKSVEKILTEKNALDRVVFVDIFSDMAKLYNLSDVIIFPVRNMRGKFDVPLAAIEPMACEKPVIISNLPILEEFANSENSIKIEAGNVEQLYKAIMDLRENPQKGLAIGQKARKFTKENFDIRNVAKQYEAAYLLFLA